MKNPSTHALALATDILKNATELTLCSIRPDGTPHASTASFASSGLTIYMAVAIGCQKAYNIQHCSRVAYTVNQAYRNWLEIQGLSVDATAQLVTGVEELSLAGALLWQKYPEFASIIANPEELPWPGMLFIRCEPSHFGLLDYTKGFGHTEHFQVNAQAHTSPAKSATLAEGV